MYCEIYPNEQDDDESCPSTDPHASHRQRQRYACAVCPKCHAHRIEARYLARRIGGAIGAMAGATSAFLVTFTSTRTIVLDRSAGPIYGTAASAIVASLAGATAGAAAGVTIGEMIDEKILNNYRCHTCGHTFSAET